MDKEFTIINKEINIKEIFIEGKNKDLENIIGKMDKFFKGNGYKGNSMEMVK